VSIETRTWVCNRLTFTDDTQKSDLMNPDLTTTELIAFLQELLTARFGVWIGKLEVTAVRSDHPSIDGPDGHNGGNAIDLAQIVDEADRHLIEDIQACEGAKGIGLGGPYQAYSVACGGYNAGSKLFEDNGTDHLHVQVVGY
jgi:hypothetical protein